MNIALQTQPPALSEYYSETKCIWCDGCGNYGICTAVKYALVELKPSIWRFQPIAALQAWIAPKIIALGMGLSHVAVERGAIASRPSAQFLGMAMRLTRSVRHIRREKPSSWGGDLDHLIVDRLGF